MIKHAKLSASGSSTWLNCPGSVKAQEGIKEKGSSFASEGTVAHALAEICLTSGDSPDKYKGEIFEGYTDHPVNDDMIRYIEDYLDYVRSKDGLLFVETRLDFSKWVPDGFGTADAIKVRNGVLEIIDLKYGLGLCVDAFENTQQLLYALGVYEFVSGLSEVKTVIMTIFQPRLDNISVYEVGVDELLNKWGELFKSKANEALSDNPKRVPGVKQCQWCKAKAVCPALKNKIEDTVMNKSKKEIKETPIEELVQVFENKKLTMLYMKAVEEHLTDRLSYGNIDGVKMVKGRGSRVWVNGVEDKLKHLLDGEIYEKKVLTPAKVEKILGKEGYGLIEDYIIKKEGNDTLVVSSDPREAISSVMDDFEIE